MRGSEVYRVLDSIASSTSSRLNESFLQRYHLEMDEMFARLHFADRNGHFTAQGAKDREEYLAIHRNMTSDEIHSRHLENKVYRRYQFESRADMNRFINYLNDPANNVPQEVVDKMAAAPMKIHGKWLMEIPENVSDENGRTIDTNRFVADFQEQTGTDVQAYNYREDYGGDGYTDGSISNTTHGIFLNELIGSMGESGRILRALDRIEYYQSLHGDMNQRHALTANTGYDEHGRESGGQFSGAKKHHKQAKVFGDVVIMDGKDITDTCTGRKVLDMHDRRLQLADDYLDSHVGYRVREAIKDKIDDSSKLSHRQKERRKRMVDAAAGHRQLRMAANAQAIHDAAAHQVYASGKEKSGRFDGGSIDKMRDNYGEQAILLRQYAGDVTISQSLWGALYKSANNSAAVGITDREWDFIDSVRERITANGHNTIAFTHEDRIMMTNVVDKIERYQKNDPSFLTLGEERAINKANERSSDGGQFRYSESELQYYGLQLGTVNQLHAIRDDLGIDLDFGANNGKLIQEIQLSHIDPNLAPLLGIMDIEFDPADGTFTDNSLLTYSKSDIKDALKNVRGTVLNEANLSYVNGYLAKDGKVLSTEDAIKELKFISDINGGILMSRNVTFDGTNYKKGKRILSDDEVLKMLETRLDRLDRKGKELAGSLNEKMKRAGIDVDKDNHFINSHSKDISTFDVLKIDNAFLAKAEAAGFNFITAAGTFDVKALEKLASNSADLAKIGISRTTALSVLYLHKADGNMVQQLIHGGSKGWGKHNFMLTKRGIATAKKGLNIAAGGNSLVGEGDEETAQFSQMANTYGSTKRHAEQIQAYSKQYVEAARVRYDEWRERHALGQNNTRKNPKQPKTKQNRAEKRALNPNAKDKYLKKRAKRLKRKERSEKIWGAIDNVTYKLNVKQRVLEWAANTKIGKAISSLISGVKAFFIRIIATVLGGYVILCGGAVALIIVISVIQALANLPFEGLKKIVTVISPDDRPAMVVLYTYMNDELQESWLDGLKDYDAAFDERNNLRYTISYDDFNSYISGFDNISVIDGNMYVNPFSYVGNNVPEENLTPITGYNGICETGIIANPSVYGEKDGTSDYVSTESGHTNNIKDILAMTDVMYNFEANKYDDTTLESILQEPVAAINFEYYWNRGTGFLKYGLKVAGTACKWVWNGLCDLFGGESEDVEFPSLSDYWGDSVHYGTIQNYVTTLYLTSHQEIFNLNVNFYPIKDVTVSVEGETTELAPMLSERNASRLHICNKLTQSNFKLAYDGSKVADKIYPYLLNDSGYKVDLSAKADADATGIPLRLDGNYGHIEDAEEACLWNGMGEDRPTYDKISADDDCWQLTSSTEDYSSYEALSGWFDDRGDAEYDAYIKVYNKYIEYFNNPPSVPKEFTLSADRNAFTRVWREACLENDHLVDVEERDVADGTEMKQYHWAGDLNAGELTMDFDESNPLAWKIVIYKNDEVVFWNYTDEETVDWETYNDGTGIKCKYYQSGVAHEYDLGDEGGYSYGYEFKPMETEVTKYKKQYRAKWSADVYCTYTEVYNRECVGHTFSYSGGVVGCEVKGVVYSATNEQLALAGMYQTSELQPIARNFVLDEAHGYEQMRGKVNKREVNYNSTIRTATITGGCKTAAEDVQGSDVSKGLNLYCVGDDELGTDMNVRSDVAIQTVRDIFDIDCMIEKGRNIFPWKSVGNGGKGWKEYEGWTEDNMALVCARVTVDWNDVYGFDIPTEIGSVSLSENDINFLSEALTMEYGSGYTESRMEAVEFALNWISRGHYSKEHKDHSFLCEACKAHTISRMYGGAVYNVSYDANCTAANSQGFVDFYLTQFGKNPTNHFYSYLWQSLTSGTPLKPGDVFYRKLERNFGAYDFSVVDLATGGNRIVDALCEFRDNDNFGIYIGELNNVFGSGIKLPKGIEMTADTITLTNGYEIHKGVPITLDLSPEPREGSMFGLSGNSGAGTVRLRTGESSGYGQTNAEENFYWFLHPDSRTFYRSFE